MSNEVIVLKAEIYDINKNLKSLDSLLSSVVHELGLDEERDEVSPQDVLDRVRFLKSLEDVYNTTKKD